MLFSKLGPLATLIVTSAALTSAPSAQGTVHVVAPAGGDFTNLQAAVDAASSGDLLLIQDGTYGPAAIDGKALVLIADAGHSPEMQSLSVLNLSANQSVTLHGLEVSTTGVTEPLHLVDNAGVVWIEGCRVIDPGFITNGASTASGLLARNCAKVIVTGSELTGNKWGTLTLELRSGAGLRAEDSGVHVFDSQITGGPGVPVGLVVPNGGGPGVEARGGFLLLSGTEVAGGDGGIGGVPGPPIDLCSDGGDGGPGLFLASDTPDVRLHDTDVQGGAPGGFMFTFPGCFEGFPGHVMDVDSGAVSNLPGVAHRFDFDAPLRSGEVGSGTIQGVPGELYWLGFSGQADTFFFADWGSTFVLGQPNFSLFLGVLPASGTTEIQFPLFHSTSDFLSFYDQVVFFDVFTSTIALSSPARKVVLNAAF